MGFTYSLHALQWDLATLVLIVGGILIEYVARYEKLPGGKHIPFVSSLSQRLRHIAVIFGISLAVVVLYGTFIEPQIITVTEAEINFPAKEELTIVALSDFHVGPFKGRGFIQRIADRVQEINPDLILLAGDFVYVGSNTLDDLLPLADLSPRYGMFAVLGNHEYSCYGGNIFTRKYSIGFDQSLKVQRALERMGIPVLVNDWTEVVMDSGPLYIGGVDDMCTNRDDIAKALPKNQKKAPVILLSHDPSIILDNQATYPHLIVAGHTHGGQIRLPFIGSLSPLPTQLGRSYDQGIFAIDKNTTLAITRGVGESGARARLFAPPEILLINTVSSAVNGH